jgi:hypothetical protein
MNTNTWDNTDFHVFRDNCERYRSSITSVDELRACYGNRKEQINDKITEAFISRIARARAANEIRRAALLGNN